MADKLIGSLIYGKHVPPKKRRPLKQRLKIYSAIGAAVIALSVAAYTYANYQEEQRVRQFFGELQSGRYDQAYADWDTAEGRYSMKDFLEDWGEDGYFTKGMRSAQVIDSNSSGESVIVYVQLDTFHAPIALLVEKESLKLSYSPRNKYRQ